ncbi:hypothetical protein BN2497_9817 [Janthinobacterium sp. CG23_2]|nr:hypothetical protein BN2497_9817 [Janthinobacterium sp. CG23_2]CUU31306.1 hypothetical protein BN3177_9817 [Janthinobacterium sp. CG23_2]
MAIERAAAPNIFLTMLCFDAQLALDYDGNLGAPLRRSSM